LVGLGLRQDIEDVTIERITESSHVQRLAQTANVLFSFV